MARILSAHVLALTLVSTGVFAATTSPTGTSATPINAKPSLVMIKASDTETARARTYSFKPAHVAAVVREDQNDGPSLIARIVPVRPPQQPSTPKLNVAKFGEAVHAALKDNVRGYALGLRKNGQPVLTLIWEWARSPQEGSRGWTLDTRMHVASVSKLMTAIVATKMLDERNLSFDTKIGQYIPAYWNEGNGSNDVTFRQLLTHTAGFTNHEGDYLSFKGQIEKGVTPGAALGYTNGSFSLIRVLNATMTGAVNRNTKWDFPLSPQLAATLNDAMWDVKSTDAFLSYAQAKVFTPSGVSNVSAVPDSVSALAYAGKTDNTGWNSGDVSTQLGGAGFRLSVNDVLNVMGTFRRSGKIVPAEKAKASIEAGLGIDQAIDTPAGKIYNKNGAWRTGTSITADIEQSVAYYLQEDMECVVLVNSWIGAQQASLRNTIRDAYINNLQ